MFSPSETYTTHYSYDAASRKDGVVFPSGYAVKYNYNSIGHFESITNTHGHELYRTVKTTALGQTKRFVMGGNMVSEREYHPEKQALTNILTTNGENILQDLWYDYDGFGNLAVRKDNMRDLEERFAYDHLNRLTGIKLNGTQTGDMGYDPYGRMKNKVSDNAFVFSAAVYDRTSKPHAIDAAKTLQGVFPDERQRITYTCFDKVKTIKEGGKTIEYAYGYDRQRTGMTERANGVVRTKRYAGGCEFVTQTENGNTAQVIYTFLTGPTGVFAVVETNGDGKHYLHYVLKDHLGSWTTITDECGLVEREQSFDAWGNLRDPETWTGTATQQPMFDRGFTGHEHITAFGLINMNGRCYDPVTSSFLSVDAYVQSPDNSQSFNRYSYCQNNPLRYTDPTGWQMIGGHRPNNPFHENWSKSYSFHAYEPRDFRNAVNLVNLAMYGNFYGPGFASGADGASASGGAVSIEDFQGTYGYHAAYQANSVYNYTFHSAQLQLIRNWHNNPSHSTNSDIREAGITNVSVGTLHGQLDGKDGYRNSYYHWTDNSGKARFAAVCLEYVGGNSNGISVLSLQPLGWYGEGNRQLNKANLLAQSLGVPLGAIDNGMNCAAKAYHNVSVLTGNLTKAQYVEALTREGVGMMKVTKGLGIAGAAASTFINGYQTFDYYINQGGTGWQVAAKSTADLVMTVVSFCGPLGFCIGVGYFVIDIATDGFGVSYEVKP